MAAIPLKEPESAFLKEAVQYLEMPSLLIRLADLVGTPMQKIADKIVPQKVAEVGNDALRKAMGWAAYTVFSGADSNVYDFEKALKKGGWTGFWHTVVSTFPAIASGPFGLAGLAVELPITTGIMLRSIASIAVDFGEDLNNPAVRLDCLAVLSHGGPSPDDDAMESSYLSSRMAMAHLVQEATSFIASVSATEVAEAIARGTAPRLVNFIARVAARFNFVVSQKFLAQSLPFISMGTGAVINAAFTDHFNRVARYHFGIRKLERLYGEELLRAAYREELASLKGPRRGIALASDR